MCGRYTLTSPAEALRALFDLDLPAEVSPRFNVAPTQTVLWIELRDGAFVAKRGRWGIVPGWAKSISGPPLINARAETVATTPMFRGAFKKWRCLVPADGFYEWQKEGKAKTPIHFRLGEREPFAFTGLTSRWTPPDGGEPVDSCAIITTVPNETCSPVHDRMPVILPRQEYRAWLDPAASPEMLRSMLAPWPGPMQAVPVSARVGNVRNDDPGCLDPAS